MSPDEINAERAQQRHQPNPGVHVTTPNKREREQKQLNKQREKERRRQDRRFAPRSGPEIVSSESIIGDVPSIETIMASLDSKNVDRSAQPIPAKLFVGSLSDITTSAGLRRHFEAHAPLIEAVVITNRETGASRNFGFVTLVDRKDAPRIISATHHSELDGHRVVVNIATER
ncbi:MAG: RNA-binding protein [Myxococcales bacterium]